MSKVVRSDHQPFDPYHRWLGIRPGAQAPTPAQLLGLSFDEEDPDVIETAMLQRTMFLRTLQTGKHGTVVVKLLNEIAQAGEEMLDPARRQRHILAERARTRMAWWRVMIPGIAGTSFFALTTLVLLVLLWTRSNSRQDSLLTMESPTVPNHSSAVADLDSESRTTGVDETLRDAPTRTTPIGATVPSGISALPTPPTPKVPRDLEAQPTNLIGDRPGEERIFAGIPFCWCPAGGFSMGSPPDENDHTGNEHVAWIRFSTGFWIGKYEVTQAEWEREMDSTPSFFSASGEGKQKVIGMDTRQFPVEQVSWNDAIIFCGKITESERARGALPANWSFTLPTEAQWEYACRAGTTTPFHFGAILNGEQANIDGNFPHGTLVRGPHLQRTARVGSYPANTWNLHDMHGNVWEWCLDSYREIHPGGIDPVVQEKNSPRVIRGGSWDYNGSFCRAAYRGRNEASYRIRYGGFRLVLAPNGTNRSAHSTPKWNEKPENEPVWVHSTGPSR